LGLGKNGCGFGTNVKGDYFQTDPLPKCSAWSHARPSPSIGPDRGPKQNAHANARPDNVIVAGAF